MDPDPDSDPVRISDQRCAKSHKFSSEMRLSWLRSLC
jgi:hypothetical protein